MKPVLFLNRQVPAPTITRAEHRYSVPEVERSRTPLVQEAPLSDMARHPQDRMDRGRNVQEKVLIAITSS
jgi:hypothetical protein